VDDELDDNDVDELDEDETMVVVSVPAVIPTVTDATIPPAKPIDASTNPISVQRITRKWRHQMRFN
jgi:hypothetical protein